jgi:tripartite-type tricarboxylate transporter receptor subunit TctC
MKISRRQFLQLAAAAAVPASIRRATAQTSYPTRTIRVLVGFGPGTAPDVAMRVIGNRLAEDWRVPVVIENVIGAAGGAAVDRVAKSTPDGYTLALAGSAAIVINPSLYDKIPYDPIDDLIPISQAFFYPNVLAVNNDVPANTLQELIAIAKARPGSLAYASAGTGTTQHLSGELLKSMAKINLQHVPYRGGIGLIPDLLGGRVAMAINSPVALMPSARDAKLRALAVTSSQRWPSAPELPTIAESGFSGFEVTSWFGLMAPARTPSSIVDKLHVELTSVSSRPDVRDRFRNLDLELIANAPAEFALAIQSESTKWAKLIRDGGLKGVD